MNETYTLKEAMDRLGLVSANAFFHLEGKYPDVFVVMKRGSKNVRSRTGIEYHKATLDRFAERREYFRRMQP